MNHSSVLGRLNFIARSTPIRFLIAMLNVARGTIPAEGRNPAPATTAKYLSLSLGIALAAQLLRPGYSETSWMGVVLALPHPEHFVSALGFDLQTFNKNIDFETLFPGDSVLSDYMRAKVGTLDPYRIGIFISQTNLELGKIFIETAEHVGRIDRIGNTANKLLFPIAFLASAWPFHFLVARKSIPVKETMSPYALLGAYGFTLSGLFLLVQGYVERDFPVLQPMAKAWISAALAVAGAFFSVYLTIKYTTYFAKAYRRRKLRVFFALLLALAGATTAQIIVVTIGLTIADTYIK